MEIIANGFNPLGIFTTSNHPIVIKGKYMAVNLVATAKDKITECNSNCPLLGSNVSQNNCVSQTRLKAANTQSLDTKFAIWGNKGLQILMTNKIRNTHFAGDRKYRIVNNK